MTDPIDIPWRGKFLEVRVRGRYEIAARVGDMDAAVILAIDDGAVILVEQYRAALDRRTIELPAGLVGDEHDGEGVELAAARELEEETGYRADHVAVIGRFASSPGMSSELFSLVRATGLTRVGDGGGDEREQIVVHRVPIAALPVFLSDRRADGLMIDAKVLVVLGPSLLA
jgi:ADP-ribose pyrophosphatase